jgi:hypothetical protein
MKNFLSNHLVTHSLQDLIYDLIVYYCIFRQEFKDESLSQPRHNAATDPHLVDRYSFFSIPSLLYTYTQQKSRAIKA